MRRLFRTQRSQASLSWLALGAVLVASAWSVREGKVGWTLFGVVLVGIILVPPAMYRSVDVTSPWPVATLAAVSFVAGVVVPAGTASRLAAYAVAATAALLVAVQIDAFTPVEMNRGFGVAFVVMGTMTAAGSWELGRWFLDLVAGTSIVESNESVMWRFVWATGSGLLAGVVFDRYLRRRVRDDFVPDGFDLDDADDQVETTGHAASEAFERIGLSSERQHQIAVGIQVFLALVVIVGVVTLSVNVVVNGLLGLGATMVPSVLERDDDVQVDVGLTMWIALAVGLHATGTVAFYQTVWGWHNIAHAVSGSLIAGVGYTLVRAVESHTDAVSFPPQFLFVFVVLSVFSAGIVWEIIEFTLDGIAAAMGTEDLVLAQHGLEDTMSDLLANTVGALVVAGTATAYRLGWIRRSEAT